MTINGYRCDHYDFTPLKTTIVVLLCFIRHLNQLLGTKCVFIKNIKICKYSVSK